MTERKIEIGGLPLTIMDGDVGPEDTVVCMRLADVGIDNPFSDNQKGSCFMCGETITFRPYMAAGQKVCMQCVAEKLSAGEPH